MFTNCTSGHVKRTVNRNDRNVMTLFDQPWSTAEIEWIERSCNFGNRSKMDWYWFCVNGIVLQWYMVPLDHIKNPNFLQVFIIRGTKYLPLTKVLIAAYAFQSISKIRMIVTTKHYYYYCYYYYYLLNFF